MNDDRVAEMLDRLTPSYDDRRGDWNRVASEARATDGGRLRGRPVRAGAVVAVVAAIAVAVLAWPFGTDQPSLLERARAAIGDGPVVHAVLRGEWGGTLIDLTTGERSPVHGENEIWYDSEQGRVHVVSRLGDAVLHDEAFTAKEPPADYAALARDYRRALDSGTARVAGEDTIDGEPVVWVTIRSLLLPDVADGKNHEFAEQVAVSRETHKPVALRALRDRVPNPGTMQRVLGLELLAAGEGDFTAPEKASLDGDSFMMGRTPITLERARAILGHPLLWLGREYQGLPLAQFFEDSTARGERRVVRVTGAKEKAALECRDLVGEEAGTCIRALGLGSVRIGADGVFRRAGRVVWHDEHTGVGLFYGTIGDDPTTYREEDDVPLYDRPNLTVTVSTDVSTLRRGAGSYVPPEGSVFVSVSRDGFLTVDGLHVSITAKDEPAIVAAARALERMPD